MGDSFQAEGEIQFQYNSLKSSFQEFIPEHSTSPDSAPLNPSSEDIVTDPTPLEHVPEHIPDNPEPPPLPDVPEQVPNAPVPDPPACRVWHGYTAGWHFEHRTRTRLYRTCLGYRYIPYRFSRSVIRNPRYLRYPRVVCIKNTYCDHETTDSIL